MNIKPFKTDADYRAALKEVESLMMAEPNTPEGEKLNILVTLIEAYEHNHFSLDLPILSKPSNLKWDKKA